MPKPTPKPVPTEAVPTFEPKQEREPVAPAPLRTEAVHDSPVPLPHFGRTGRQRTTASLIAAVPLVGGSSIGESVFSRRRLRAILIPLAFLILVGVSGAAWYLNTDYQGQQFAQRIVLFMANATSYHAVGSDDTSDASGTRSVREEFSYIAPSEVAARYITTLSRAGGGVGSSVAGGCEDRETAILHSTRYQRCNDADVDNCWLVDSYDSVVFDTLAFCPWMRFAWCKGAPKKLEPQQIRGVDTSVFTCEVSPELEANSIFEKLAADGSYDPDNKQGKAIEKSKAAREKFIRETSVDITVWVRNEDGYIGRFAMTKSSPGTLGTTSQTIDYVYDQFGVVPPLDAPDLTATAPDIGTEAPEQLNEATFSLLTVNGATFSLEVADQPAEWAAGLSFRSELPRDQGLLFVFPESSPVTFWMKDVFIPLDVIFIDSTFRIVDIQTMEVELGIPDSELIRYPSASVSNQQKWDTLEAERSGVGWRVAELPEGLVVAPSPFDRSSLHLLPALQDLLPSSPEDV